MHPGIGLVHPDRLPMARAAVLLLVLAAIFGGAAVALTCSSAQALTGSNAQAAHNEDLMAQSVVAPGQGLPGGYNAAAARLVTMVRNLKRRLATLREQQASWRSKVLAFASAQGASLQGLRRKRNRDKMQQHAEERFLRTPGPRGPRGLRGEQGQSGLDGTAGRRGPTGTAGAEGWRGPEGHAGRDGWPGATGARVARTRYNRQQSQGVETDFCPTACRRAWIARCGGTTGSRWESGPSWQSR